MMGMGEYFAGSSTISDKLATSIAERGKDIFLPWITLFCSIDLLQKSI